MLNIKFIECKIKDITELIKEYIVSLSSPIDSFLEEYILKSDFFLISNEDEEIGYCAIYDENMITQFYVIDEYRCFSQEIFMKVKQIQNVSKAFVPTCDEYFLSHAMDSFTAIEKQAYFFVDLVNSTAIPKNKLNMRIAVLSDAEGINKKSDTYFDNIEDTIKNGQLYIICLDEEEVGYGTIHKGIILKKHASIGMYTIKKHRNKGIGTDILLLLKKHLYSKGYTPIAGCWYNNHNSKKTLEKARLFTVTRLLIIHF